MIKIPRLFFVSAATAISVAVLKIGLRQTMEDMGFWSLLGGGLIIVGAIILYAALAIRKESHPP